MNAKLTTKATVALDALEGTLARKGYQGSFLVTDLGWGVKAEWNGSGCRRDINALCCREAVKALERVGYLDASMVLGTSYITARKPANVTAAS